MSYLDTRDYYTRRTRQILWALLRRAYYCGYPYSSEPLDGYDYSELWREYMQATDKVGDVPPELENIGRLAISGIVDDIIPPGTEIQFPGIKDTERKAEVLGRLFTFGSQFGTGEEGFMDWLASILADVAVTGDGGVFLRRLYDGRGAFIHYQFYESELWDYDQPPEAIEPDFYRIQYKFKKAYIDSDGAWRSRTYWHRLDIYKDRLVRYADEPTPWDIDDGVPPPNIKPDDDGLLSWMPPDMNVKQPDQDQLEEGAAISSLGEFVFKTLVWDYISASELRGETYLTVDRLAGIDDNNRLLYRQSRAAIQAGEPLLAGIDVDLPVNPEGIEGTIAENIYQLSSQAETGGKLTYPSNQPEHFPHNDARQQVRQAILRDSQNLGLSASELVRTGDISGFAMGQITKQHRKAVLRLRSRLISNRIIPMIHLGMKMLEQAGFITAEESKQPPVFVYPTEQFSPDEELKMATTIQMWLTMGIPPEDIATLLPFKSKDPQRLIAALKKKIEAEDELLEAKNTMLGMTSAKSPEDTAGVDKRNRTSSGGE